MAKTQEVEHIAKKLDKMVHKKNTDGALDLLMELKNIKMSLETLQSTRVGMSVNAVRKHSSEEEVQTLAKVLIKSWKKLLDGAEGKLEEKKNEDSPVRSSSTSKDSGSTEKSNTSGDSPTTSTPPIPPITPTTPPITPTTPPITPTTPPNHFHHTHYTHYTHLSYPSHPPRSGQLLPPSPRHHGQCEKQVSRAAGGGAADRR
ncbi:hypothetical protein CgunFtcFv8_001009 [Champsocephalus gunnari]|uniref:TFIIS N-terminal domain-containing protein n=1 Tax=Champsocephalus gunnari TaxID=52237 RepID=A0AAN8DPX8_CHAGU|nr:hypothetical protein CgunFtcFv8_001009 [Champsocephalus gunnari]